LASLDALAEPPTTSQTAPIKLPSVQGQPGTFALSTGFGYPQNSMTTPIPSVEEHLARLEGSFKRIDRCLTTLEQGVRGLRADLNARMSRLEERLASRIDRLENRIDHLFYGLLGAIAASTLATVLTRLL
jgi:hypothetical protein